MSVGVPFYNVEKYADTCVLSILAQMYRDFELVLVDDGSTDYTRSILGRYAAADSRVKLITQENLGLFEARNNGVHEASGDFISFVGGDDVVSPYYLETLVTVHGGRLDRMAVGSYVTFSTRELRWKMPGCMSESQKNLSRSRRWRGFSLQAIAGDVEKVLTCGSPRLRRKSLRYFIFDALARTAKSI